jgi:hypothetical protein
VRHHLPAILTLFALLALYLVIASAVTGNAESLIAGLAALSAITMLRYIQHYFTR